MVTPTLRLVCLSMGMVTTDPSSQREWSLPTLRREVRRSVNGHCRQCDQDSPVKVDVIDFTGGKKETTAGRCSRGCLRGATLEVVRPRAVDPNQRGTEPGEVLEIDLRYRLRPVK